MRHVVLALALGVMVWADAGGGLKWAAPSNWKNDGTTRPMRAATYAVPATAGDKDAGECVVYYFGKGQGGGVEANLQRWTGQFKDASGQPVKNAVTKKKTVHGMPVTTIDVNGSYSGMGGPMMAAQAAKPGYRMLGAIVEGPEGSVFFKFTGQGKTVAANQKGFDAMVESVAK